MQKRRKVFVKDIGEIDHRIRGIDHPYMIMLLVYALMLVFAFSVDGPAEIYRGFLRIITSRSVLITDYTEVGGLGAAFFNASLTGILSIILLRRLKVKPNGSIVMAMWLTAGFSMMGKNFLNMWPILLGVYLHSLWKKEPFIRYALVALLSATMSPIVSGICFHPEIPAVYRFPLGICLGIASGFLFPAVSSFAVRVHSGYNLYNLGFAGGIMSTFVVSGLSAFGIRLERELLWSVRYTDILEGYVLLVCIFLILLGILSSECGHKLSEYKRLLKHPGRLVSDFYMMHGNMTYFNMGLLGLLSTIIVRILKIDMNGATLCGLFTIIGFGAFGKHIKNTFPVMGGAILCAFVNEVGVTTPANSMAILFCTCLAPIAGEFGMAAGIVAGFLHVNTITHIGFLNSGLNLYNNGYAGGFVTLLIVPVLLAIRKEL